MKYFKLESDFGEEFEIRLKNLKDEIINLYNLKQKRAEENQSNIIKLHSSTLNPESTYACLEALLKDKVTMGKIVEEYENAYSSYLKMPYYVLSNNSGSSSNLLAIATLIEKKILRKGDKVVVPSLAWSTTVFPLIQYGLIPIFCDANELDYNIDADRLNQICEKESPKAIMLIHTYGCPADMDAILDISRQYDLTLIEDVCESMGAEWNGQKAGTFGRVSTFSSYFSHHICTLEGGLTCFSDHEDYQVAGSIRSHGWTRHFPKDSEVFKQNSDIDPTFLFAHCGYNLRLSEPQAAMGIEELKRLDSYIHSRQIAAEEYIRYFSQNANLFSIIKPRKGAKSSWFGFPVILKGKLKGQRSNLRDYLQENQIETRPFLAGDFTKQPVMRKHPNISKYPLPISREISREGFALPCHQSITIENVDRVIKYIKRFIDIRLN